MPHCTFSIVESDAGSNPVFSAGGEGVALGEIASTVKGKKHSNLSCALSPSAKEIRSVTFCTWERRGWKKRSPCLDSPGRRIGEEKRSPARALILRSSTRSSDTSIARSAKSSQSSSLPFSSRKVANSPPRSMVSGELLLAETRNAAKLIRVEPEPKRVGSSVRDRRRSRSSSFARYLTPTLDFQYGQMRNPSRISFPDCSQRGSGTTRTSGWLHPKEAPPESQRRAKRKGRNRARRNPGPVFWSLMLSFRPPRRANQLPDPGGSVLRFID